MACTSYYLFLNLKLKSLTGFLNFTSLVDIRRTGSRIQVTYLLGQCTQNLADTSHF